VGSRADLDAVEKRKISCPCQESNLGHPVRSPSLYKPKETLLPPNVVKLKLILMPTQQKKYTIIGI
jgi:hypothetical protein